MAGTAAACPTIRTIKLTGLFFLISGWVIVLAAVALLAGGTQRAFAAAGGAVEAGGLALLCRAHAGKRT